MLLSMAHFRFPIFLCSLLVFSAAPSQATTITGGDQVIETEPTPPPKFADDVTATPGPTPAPESPVDPTDTMPSLPTLPVAPSPTTGGLQLEPPTTESISQPSATPPAPPADEYTMQMRAAAADFKDEKMDAALLKLDEAEKLRPGTADVINFRGAIFAGKGDFAEAKKLYEQASIQNPGAFWPRYNLSEVEFMQKKYADARTKFTAMLEKYPANELIQFKIVLTYLMENNQPAAQAELEKFRFPSNTSAYYFAWAAWEFSRGNTTEANDWIKSGTRIFGREKTDFVYQSLGDLKWVPMPRP